MKDFITALDPNYQLDKYHIKNNVAVFYISSKMSEVKCPYCGTLSSKVHSSYEREIQDLPMQNRKVILLVKTRKMFCSNCKCEKKTFSECHPFEYYGAAEPPVRCDEVLPQLSVNRIEIKVPK